MAKTGYRKSDIRLQIPRPIYEKMLFVARECQPNEVQMLGEIVEQEKEMNFEVKEVHLIKQVVSGGRAQFDDEALALFVGSHSNPENLWFWMHSHVKMGNFWSPEDTATMDRLLGGMDKLVSFVMCVDGSYLARFDFSLGSVKERIKKISWADPAVRRDIFRILFLPSRVHWDDIAVDIEHYLSQSVEDTLREEVKEKVKATQVERGGVVMYPPGKGDGRQGMLIAEPDMRGVACCKTCEFLKVQWTDDVMDCSCSHPEEVGRKVEDLDGSCKHYLPRSSRHLLGRDMQVGSCGSCIHFRVNEEGLGDVGFCWKDEEGANVHVNDYCEDYQRNVKSEFDPVKDA